MSKSHRSISFWKVKIHAQSSTNPTSLSPPPHFLEVGKRYVTHQSIMNSQKDLQQEFTVEIRSLFSSIPLATKGVKAFPLTPPTNWFPARNINIAGIVQTHYTAMTKITRSISSWTIKHAQKRQ